MVVQIIGRATRDCEGKSHAQFTNLIAQPDAEDEDVKGAVNNMLKAITLSLLMREVLAPVITFRPRSSLRAGETPQAGDIIIEDGDKPVSPRIREILTSGGVDQIIATLINKSEVINPAITKQIEPKIVTEVEIPKIITQLFPDLPLEEVSLLGDLTKAKLVISASGGLQTEPVVKPQSTGQDDKDSEGGTSQGMRAFLRIGERLINVDQLDIDLIDSVNPFQGAYEILSKSVTAPMLKTILDHVTVQHSDMSEEETVMLWPKIKDFTRQFGREPATNATEAYERRLAEALAFVRSKKAQQMASQAQG